MSFADLCPFLGVLSPFATLVVKVIERRTGLASTQFLRREMFQSTDYRNFVRVHHELRAMAGTPPLTVGQKAFGKWTWK